MDDKVFNKTENQYKKDRFSFELRVNDNIICQRYFRINDFKYKSIGSNELTDTLIDCVELIKRDLEDKSRIFTEYTAPQIFDDEEEMNTWISRHNFNKDSVFKIDPFRYVIFRNSEKVYFWDGKTMEVYNGYFNRADYLPITDKSNCILKFVFLDRDKEVYSEIWDGNDYPKFIRTNIDLSNTKNKYKTSEVFSPFESSIVDIMKDGREDLIPIIINDICTCCSYEDDSDYTNYTKYGSKKYSLRPTDEYNNEIYRLGKKLQKKTDNYFNRWS